MTVYSGVSPSLTFRNIDDELKERLRVRAAQQGHSMEEEARIILRRTVGGVNGDNLWSLSRRLFESKQGVDLDLPSRAGDRAPPVLGKLAAKRRVKRK